MNFAQRFLATSLSLSLLLFTIPQDLSATPPNLQEEYADLSDNDLDALVAPIALYPDALVAQVLGGATYPDQIVEANDFLKGNPNLTGEALQRAVEQQSWDPAVQALTQFPSVLDNLAKNISWTSALGEASALQQEATLAAVQRMRAQAYAAGNLKSSKEIKVVQESPQVIVIQPANPQVVYVPTYNPTVVYGTTVVTPGYSTSDVVAASVIAFGVGIAVGAAISNSSCGYSYWGWGMSWGVRTISCGGGYYYGNPYWWGGYYPGYRPGYRPPYYPPPRPPYYGGRPPYPGGGNPAYPRPTPLPAPVPGNPPRPNPGRPPTTLPAPTPRPTPGRPSTLPAPSPTPRPTPGKPTTMPAPTPRPTPGKPTVMPAPAPSPSPGPSTRPTNQSYRGYQQAPAAKPAPSTAQKPNAFSGSAGGRPQSARGNRSMSSTPAPSGGARKR
ncbi:MAG TPA: DUF3300 domain-containing protein [Candidatus Acidoferrum sp.]